MKNKLLFLKHFEGITGYGVNLENLTEHSTTYGEVDEESMPIINELFMKYAPLNKIAIPFRNFYDLGSGVGKLVIAMASMNPTLESTGIEIVPDRVKSANIGFEKIKDEALKNRIELLCISMLDDSINYSNACWIFISNLCLTEKINDELFDKLAKEVKTGCIIICSSSTENKSFKQLNYVTVPMTWSAKSKVHIYTKI